MSPEGVRTVVVSGGGTGIGRAIAEAFAERGDRVTLIGRREDVLRKAAGELGPRVSYVKADVSQRAEVSAAVERIVAAPGRIDVLVNNAGFAEGVLTTTAIDQAETTWDRVIDANLKGSFLMAMAVAPVLPRPGGRIINISSIAAFVGGSRPGAIPYAAAKKRACSASRSLSPAS
jgi:3-oxoacyl-[acyl-carrier protein] reductase